jgi:CheY-like chemotaxis protein
MASPSEPPEPGSQGNGAAPRVLVVDDYALNLDLASFVLQADGFQVECATDARAAQACIARFAPALILMDIQLPGMDGLSLTRLLKSDPATQHIVIIAFTAYAMTGDEARMLDAGCDAYIAKPIDVKSFAATVRALLPRGPARA